MHDVTIQMQSTTVLCECLAGERFTVQVAAFSPNAAVATWFLPMYYDPAVLTYSSYTVASLWTSPYVNLQASSLTPVSGLSTTFQ